MRHFWETELTPERTEELIEKIADEVFKRRMEVPAVMVLEIHKPISNLVSHGVLYLGGFLAPVVGPDLFDDLTRLLRNRDNVEALIQRIEAKADARSKEEKKK